MKGFKINYIFILLLIAALFFALAQGGNLPYSIFYGFAGAFFIGIFYVTHKFRNIEIDTRFKRQIYSAGEEDEFLLIVRNLGLMPTPFVLIKNFALAELDSRYKGDWIFLSYDNNKWIKTTVKFIQRGIYDFGKVKVQINDLFNIFEYSKIYDRKLIIRVYPKIYNISKIEANGSDIFKNAENNRSTIEDLYTVRDVRKYNPGDNIRRINWKISAKHGELYVRNFDRVSGDECNVFIDMSEGNYEFDKSGIIEERMVDFCASVINYTQLKGIKSNLYINSPANRNFGIESREDFNEMMEFFINHKSSGDKDYMTFINSNLSRIPRLSWMGIITSRVDKYMVDNLIKMADYGYNLTVFYASDNVGDEKIDELKKFGINCLSCSEIINKAGK